MGDTGMIQAKAQMKEMSAEVEGESEVAQTRAPDTFGRPTLVNMTMPMVAQVDCPMTYGDEALKDQCLGKSHCAWSEYSGCRDWSDEEFCQRQSGRHGHTQEYIMKNCE